MKSFFPVGLLFCNFSEKITTRRKNDACEVFFTLYVVVSSMMLVPVMFYATN